MFENFLLGGVTCFWGVGSLCSCPQKPFNGCDVFLVPHQDVQGLDADVVDDKLKLNAGDGETFEVDKKIAIQSELIKVSWGVMGVLLIVLLLGHHRSRALPPTDDDGGRQGRPQCAPPQRQGQGAGQGH